MRRSVFPILAVISSVLALGGRPVFGQARDLYPNTPDEVIVKRAAQQAKPLWQIPLGPALIEDMQSLGPGKLLIGLRKDFPGLPNLDYMLVDTDKSEVIWRFPRDKIKGEYDCLVVLQDLILFRVDNRKAASLLALDTRTGKQKWIASQKGEQVTFIPLLAVGLALAVNPSQAAVELTALDLEGGQEVWKKTIPVTNSASLPQPLPVGEDLLIFYNGLERITSREGKSVYARPELMFDSSSPPPQIGGGVIWAVHSGVLLSAVDATSGNIRWTVSLPGTALCTNIYPLDGKLYLRSIGLSQDHIVSAIHTDDGQLLWTFAGAEPSVSNLIESGGILYFGTPTSLLALNADDGKQFFAAQVTTTGRTFPIRLRIVEDRVIYIGELVVAAFDAKTGRSLYKQGMTPGAEELHLNGLDSAAPNLKQELARQSSQPGSKTAGTMIGFATAEMGRFQNLAQNYSSQAASAASRGDTWGSTMSGARSAYAQREAAFQSTLATALSITNLVMTFKQFLYARSLETFIERQSLFRKSILASYAQAENDEYVYRPHLVYHDTMDTFSALSIVHLPTGKRSETMLSPHYLSYGLWQVVDFNKSVVYYSNIGMDPSQYELSGSRAYYPYKKAKTVNTFLIAQPVKIPSR